MADIDDLSALKIEREPLNVSGGSRTKWMVILVLLAIAGGGAYYWFQRERPIEVEIAAVTERAASSV